MYALEYDQLIKSIVNELSDNPRFIQTKRIKQHGNLSIFEHSLFVARTSCLISSKLNLDVDYRIMIRGALLHDYFLYDWHDINKDYSFHAFSHPHTALQNANEDFDLNKREKNIILRHMFPITPIPPMYKESWVVCIADKCCAIDETIPVLNILPKKL